MVQIHWHVASFLKAVVWGLFQIIIDKNARKTEVEVA